MFRKLTAKEMQKIDRKVEAYAREKLEKYTPEQVAMMVWNRFGYLSGTKNGSVIIQGYAKMEIRK